MKPLLIKKILKLVYPYFPLKIRKYILQACGYSIGNKAYLPSCLKISDLKSRTGNVKIGDRASLGPRVLIVTDSSPNNSKLIKKFPLVSDNVIIENDVWIGANVVILPGVTIGECSVIAAGSVINKDIPPFTIAAGVPAKVIKQIDPNEL